MDRAIALIKAVEKPLIHYIHPKNMKNAFRAFFCIAKHLIAIYIPRPSNRLSANVSTLSPNRTP